MGIEIVELIVEIENEFEIEVTNIEAEDMETVGDCLELITLKLNSLERRDEIKNCCW